MDTSDEDIPLDPGFTPGGAFLEMAGWLMHGVHLLLGACGVTLVTWLRDTGQWELVPWLVALGLLVPVVPIALVTSVTIGVVLWLRQEHQKLALSLLGSAVTIVLGFTVAIAALRP